MAIYHCSIKIISRGKGKSAVAAAAYRAGEKIVSEYDGRINDYTRKKGIAHTEIMLPDHAPIEYRDRAVLWNAVERIEKFKTAQLAREIQLALPKELSEIQNINLVREYVKQNFVDKGMCADIAIHDTNKENPHAHIMLTMRPINLDGTWGDKQKKEYILNGNGEKIYDKNKRSYKCKSIPTTDWNEQTKAEEWRSAWADIANTYLEKTNNTERIDHRSFERQGITDQLPTIHLGVAAHQMEQKGIRTERGDINREIADINKEIRQTKARIKKLKTQIYSQPIENAPSFISIMSHIADAKNLNSRWQKIVNLQTQARVLIFLQQNNISDMDSFVDKVTQISEKLNEVSDKIKKADRRLETLETHLAHCENRKQYKDIYDKYKRLAPKDTTAAQNSLNPFTKNKAIKEHEAAVAKQDVFYEKHSAEIEAYQNANKYLKAVLNGKTDIPTQAWKKELVQLTDTRISLAESFYNLKDELKNAEVLRRGMDELMKDELQRSKPQRVHGAEL